MVDPNNLPMSAEMVRTCIASSFNTGYNLAIKDAMEACEKLLRTLPDAKNQDPIIWCKEHIRGLLRK